MTLVLLRDDDANATTDPDRLARVYAPLFDAGSKVCLSTIPAVDLSTLAPDGQRERFIHPDFPVEDREVELARDTPLVSWISENRSGVDVLVHGHTHARRREGTEFGALTQTEAAALLRSGLEVADRAFGFRPVGFVAPWDALSDGAVRATAESYRLVSTGWLDRGRLPRRAWPAHVVERLGRREALRVGGAWFLRHRGGKITPDMDPKSVPEVLAGLVDRADVAVVVLHHWMFWGDDPHPVVTALARALQSHRVGGVDEALRHLDGLPPWRRL
jgi:hypothetical protein